MPNEVPERVLTSQNTMVDPRLRIRSSSPSRQRQFASSTS